MTDLSLSKQTIFIMLAGGGLGLILSPASTDAVNHAPSSSYSEVTGITQTARNFGASVGIALLGTILLSTSRTNVATQLEKVGVPARVAHRVAQSFNFSASSQGTRAHEPAKYVHAVQLAFAQSTQTVFYIMAGVLAVTFLVVVRFLPRGARTLEAAQPESV